MQEKIDPQTQTLLDELKEKSYLVRQKEIAKIFEPHNDIVIPLLLERLRDQSDNYHIRDNALEVLALSSDARSILPILRFIEINSGWTSTVFRYMREGLQEKNYNAHQKVNEQLIRYLEEGPKIPAPEPYDPVAKEKSFNDFLGYLMKQSGVSELDEKTEKLAGEAKQKWMQPRDTTEDEKNKFLRIQDIIVEVIDTLSEFDGLGDARLALLLSKYIKEYGFVSNVSQHALTALSKIEVPLAIADLNELATTSPPQQDTTVKRVVGRDLDKDLSFYDFTICIREPDADEWNERAYYFRYEEGLVFFLTRGAKVAKWFVGQASNKNNTIQLAIDYLERWIHDINSLAQDISSLAHVADRYAECIHLVQQHINFEKYGFIQTHISVKYEAPQERPQIIYDSEWCRVKISYRSYGEMHNQSDVLTIQYGRLHAADKENTILWNGEPHHCWHRLSLALSFLDGMSPEDAAKDLWNHPIMKKYKESKSGEQPEIEAGMHAMIWEQYGQRLFTLFDLRRPDLWDKYSLFVKQVYELLGFNRYQFSVPREKIC